LEGELLKKVSTWDKSPEFPEWDKSSCSFDANPVFD
jgi:hypothetical protein